MSRHTPKAPPADHQCAALCWREAGGRVEILLITSRNTGRWVLPKGWLMKGSSPAESAAQEAWEEAGVEGRICSTPLGWYSYPKPEFGQDHAVDVVVFPLEVTALSEVYPERGQRDRIWVDPLAAADLVEETALDAILRLFVNRRRSLTAGALRPHQSGDAAGP